MTDHRLRCLACLRRWLHVTTAGADACPFCGSRNVKERT